MLEAPRSWVIAAGLVSSLSWAGALSAQDAAAKKGPEDRSSVEAEASEADAKGETAEREGGTDSANAGGESGEASESSSRAVAGRGKGKKSSLALRKEMLERVGDQLSKRMRSLKEREEALAKREEAVAEREAAVDEREKMLGSMEELMRLREDVVERREELPPPQSWKGPEPPDIYARYAAVLDGSTMQFFHKKAAHTEVPVASTQKLVTALVVCHAGDLDEMVDVPPEVLEVEPTVIGVKPGERYSRRQLLTALLVRSGNDIAATLAIDNAGSVEAFAEKMNTLARYIGMTDSNFVNPHGLPAEGQYSTARDIAIAAYEAYQVPEIREMIRRRTYEFVFDDGREVMLYNTNKVLGQFEGCNGMKTGFTYAAGNCLVSSARVESDHRISVVLKSARPHVWEDSKELLQWSFDLEMTGPVEDLAAAR